MLSLNGAAVTELTLAKIRGLYSKTDAEMTGLLVGAVKRDGLRSFPVGTQLDRQRHAIAYTSQCSEACSRHRTELWSSDRRISWDAHVLAQTCPATTRLHWRCVREGCIA